MFGTNHAKMFTIREREIGLHNPEENYSSSDEASELKVACSEESKD